MRYLRLAASNRPGLAPVTEHALRAMGLTADVAAVVVRTEDEIILAVGETVVGIRAGRDATGVPLFGYADLTLARAWDAARELGGLPPVELSPAPAGESPVTGEELAATLWRGAICVQAIGDDDDHLLVANLGGRKVTLQRDRRRPTLWHARDARGRPVADPMPWYRLVDWAAAEDTLPEGFGSAA